MPRGFVISLCLLSISVASAARPDAALVRPGQVGTTAELQALARNAPIIVVGAIMHHQRVDTGCQTAWQLDLHTTALVVGRPLDDLHYAAVLAGPPKGKCERVPAIPTLKRYQDVSLQGPVVLLLDRPMLDVDRDQDNPFAPTFGAVLYGLTVVGAAPLSALPEIVAASAPTDAIHRLVVPLTPEKWTLTRKTAQDTRTGLTWQRRAASKAMPLKDALAYCEQLTLDGKTDWRLPELPEVLSLFSHQDRQRGASPKVFPGLTDEYFWTSTDDDSAWVSVLKAGEYTSTHYDQPSRYGSYRTLCVRRSSPAAPVLSFNRLRVSGKTVIDPRSGRQWHTPTPPRLATFAAAMDYCRASRVGGFRDWRLPSFQELLTLVDNDPYVRKNPLFPVHRKSSEVWTRTRNKEDGHSGVYALYRPRAYGYKIARETADTTYNVRCVRPFEPEPLRWTSDDRDVALQQPNGTPGIRGRLRDGLRDGLWEFIDDRARTVAQVRYVRGLAQGRSRIRYVIDSDVYVVQSGMKNGLRHGRVQMFSEAGEPIASGEFKGGRLVRIHRQ